MDSIIFQPPTPDSAYLIRKDYRESPVPHIYLPARNNHSGHTIIYYHGNATDCHQMSTWAQQFTHRGYNVMLIEYPGYGPYHADGPNRTQIHHDINILTRKLSRKERYHVIGQSIGTGPASELAKKMIMQRIPLQRLTLITPYTSIAELSGDFVLVPVLDLFTRIGMWMFMSDDFPTLDNAVGLAQVGIPVEVHHGANDEIIPYHHAQRFQHNGCKLHTYPCMHNDILEYCNSLVHQCT